ncbi:hypothetical protein MUK42_33759 [Musa troglodytarum]|uniref:Uncharacterized protein n=1 Tax=Musa troglodytarum TaxID=320322 RepID=A0A9E7GQ39_9LILI|nr:hypothetical protein MUK42_33759 [Musa troglodytarum]
MEEMIMNKAFANVINVNITMVDGVTVKKMADRTPLDHMTN